MFEAFLERRKVLIFGLLIYLMPTPVIWSYMLLTLPTTPYFGATDYSDASSFSFFLWFFGSSFLWLPVYSILFLQPLIVLYFAASYGLLAYFYKREKQRMPTPSSVLVPVD